MCGRVFSASLVTAPMKPPMEKQRQTKHKETIKHKIAHKFREGNKKGHRAEGQGGDADLKWKHRGQRGQYSRQISSMTETEAGIAWEEGGAGSRLVTLCAVSEGVGKQSPKAGLEG